MRTLALTFLENIPFKKVKEAWLGADKVLVCEVVIAVLLIFAKVYVNSNYIYEKNAASVKKKEIKKEESKVKLMKIQLEKLKNTEKLNEYSKNLNMEENIDVVIVKQ